MDVAAPGIASWSFVFWAHFFPLAGSFVTALLFFGQSQILRISSRFSLSAATDGWHALYFSFRALCICMVLGFSLSAFLSFASYGFLSVWAYFILCFVVVIAVTHILFFYFRYITFFVIVGVLLFCIFASLFMSYDSMSMSYSSFIPVDFSYFRAKYSVFGDIWMSYFGYSFLFSFLLFNLFYRSFMKIRDIFDTPLFRDLYTSIFRISLYVFLVLGWSFSLSSVFSLGDIVFSREISVSIILHIFGIIILIALFPGIFRYKRQYIRSVVCSLSVSLFILGDIIHGFSV